MKAWNSLNGNLLATYQGHQDGLLDLEIVPRPSACEDNAKNTIRDRLLAAGDSNDSTVKLFEYDYGAP